jgi:hypothetical protein
MKQKLLLLASIFTTIFSFAQVKEEEKNEPETQSRIKVYTPSSSLKKAIENNNSYKWAVKTDMFAYIVGEFPLSFEYRVTKKLAVEAAAGVTYSFWPNAGVFEDDKSQNDSDAKPAMGSVFRGTLKYYPSSDYDAIEGWNFGIQLFSKTNNRDYSTENNSPESKALVGKQNSRVKTGISLIIGKQLFQDSNIAFESYIGIGFAKTVREFSTVESIYNESSGNYTYTLSPKKLEDTAPNFQLGFKIGFGN